MKKALAIVPARFASTRFPGKPLVKIRGKTMIERVVEQAAKCPSVSEIIVATDHLEIQSAVHAFGGKVVMTSENCQSGTDRCAEVMLKTSFENEIIVNIQGDEPFIHPEQIEQLIGLMQSATVQIGTLAKKITDSESIFNPNVVKLVRSLSGKALYFSRNPIPFVRAAEGKDWLRSAAFFKHIGMYAYQKSVLTDIAKLPQGSLEMAESLEQLRWLEAGYDIYVSETELESIGIDTPEDLSKAEEMFRKSFGFE